MPAMFENRHDLSLSRTVAREFVSDQHTWRPALLLEQLQQQAFGRLGIAAALDKNVAHGPVLIHGTLEPMFPARDANHNLIKIPLVSSRGQTSTDLVGKILAELHRPPPHGLMADQDTSGSEHPFNHLQAQGEPEI
jgi:hypothetical protein